MDLVNSVTETSNDRSNAMENKADEMNAGSKAQSLPQPEPKAKQVAAAAGGFMSHQQSMEKIPSRSQVPEYLRIIGMDPRNFWPKKYRFTREKSPGLHNPLSVSQRNFYESNGYMIIDGCVSQRLLDSVKLNYNKGDEAALELLTRKLVTRNDRLLQYVKCFCDERLMLMTNRLVDRFHDQSQRLAQDILERKQIQHQQLFRDMMYLPFRPIDRVVCVVTAIEPIEHVFLAVPGTHRIGQCTISSTRDFETIESQSFAHEDTEQRGSQAKEIFECAPDKYDEVIGNSRSGCKFVDLKPGQSLFYHPALIHGFSNDLVNLRKQQLASIAYYAAADCDYIDLRRTPELAEPNGNLPVGLAHFGDKNPNDYTSWLDKPLLLEDRRANL